MSQPAAAPEWSLPLHTGWLEAGYNPSEQLYATCTDIDPMVADMAFIQLALLGIPAKVVTGNTLTLKANRVRYTPVYYFNDWQGRLAFRSVLTQ
jgi:hypothetical protein